MGKGGVIRQVALSPDGRMVAAVEENDTVSVWSTLGGHLIAVLKGRARTICAVSFSWDGRRVVAGSAEGTAEVYDLDWEQPADLAVGPADVE